MTKKDYIMLARVIGEAWAEEREAERRSGWIANRFAPIRSRLVANLTRELQRDNPRFDCERFAEAVEKARVGA